METQKVTYPFEGRVVEFEIGKLTWGRYQSVISKAGKMRLVGNTQQGEIDSVQMADDITKACVKCLSEPAVDFHELEARYGMDLQRKALEFNGLGEAGEKSFPAP